MASIFWQWIHHMFCCVWHMNSFHLCVKFNEGWKQRRCFNIIRIVPLSIQSRDYYFKTILHYPDICLFFSWRYKHILDFVFRYLQSFMFSYRRKCIDFYIKKISRNLEKKFLISSINILKKKSVKIRIVVSIKQVINLILHLKSLELTHLH